MKYSEIYSAYKKEINKNILLLITTNANFLNLLVSQNHFSSNLKGITSIKYQTIIKP